MGRTHGDAVKDASLVQKGSREFKHLLRKLVQGARWSELVQRFKSSKSSRVQSSRVQRSRGSKVKKCKEKDDYSLIILHSSFFLTTFARSSGEWEAQQSFSFFLLSLKKRNND
jgi:hypothetical protein